MNPEPRWKPFFPLGWPAAINSVTTVASKLNHYRLDGLRPLAGHGEPRDRQREQIEGRESRHDPARDRLARAHPPERKTRREQENQQANVGDEVADAEPGWVVVAGE